MAWTDNFPWVQATVGAVTILGTALKLPAARLDWAEEHRRFARIERQSNAIDKISHPSVKRVFERDNEWQALNVLAIRQFPYKRRLRIAVYLGRVAYVGGVVLVGYGIWSSWPSIPFFLSILGLFLAYYINRVVTDRLKLYKTNRKLYVLLGAPHRFRYATRSKVPRRENRDKQRHIGKEFELRARRWEWAEMDVTREELQTEIWCVWNELLDEQREERFAFGQKLRERLNEVNESDPRPDLFEALKASLDRTDARITNRTGGRIRPRRKLAWREPQIPVPEALRRRPTIEGALGRFPRDLEARPRE
ncbi:hypothetical protein JF710_21200 [Mycobacterium intracellulare]|uniref:hypothetical protein n=1 Tax=Mycobacterium intracellulare TaxID=1767 RepID=UPI001CDAC2A5|nr:hypothetical protein [Mycobacterium intracellulare]MCA2255699.1 hypothetical protein [Mycobacterium intracellulare]